MFTSHSRRALKVFFILMAKILRSCSTDTMITLSKGNNGRSSYALNRPTTISSWHPEHEALPWTEVSTFEQLKHGCRQNGGGKFRITASFKFPRHITINGGNKENSSQAVHVTISGAVSPPSTAHGKQRFVFDGQNRTNFFSVRNNASLLVLDMEFTNGHSVLGGAVSLLRGSRAAFTGVTFTRCHSAVDGGAIRSKESTLIIENSAFSQCTSHFYGGGVSLISNPTVHMRSIIFEQTEARLAGGGIHVAGAKVLKEENQRFYTKLYLENSSFLGCKAQYEGGSLFIGDANFVELYGVNFDSAAAKYGGAIYSEGSKTSTGLYGCTFQNCSAQLGHELKRSSGELKCLGCSRGFTADSCRHIECDGCVESCLVDCTCTACGEACPNSVLVDAQSAEKKWRIGVNEPLEDVVSHYKSHDEIVVKFSKSIKKAASHHDFDCVKSMETFAEKCKITKDCLSGEYLVAARCSRRKQKTSNLTHMAKLGNKGWLNTKDLNSPKVLKALKKAITDVHCGFSTNTSSSTSCDKVVDILDDAISQTCTERQMKRPEPIPPQKEKKGVEPPPPQPRRWTPIEDFSQSLRSLKLVEDLSSRSQFYDAYPVPIMVTPDKLNSTCERFDHRWRFCPGANSTRHLFYQCDIRRFVAAVDCGFIDIGTLGFSKAAKEKKQKVIDQARSAARKNGKKGKALQEQIEAATRNAMSNLRTDVKMPGLVHTWNESFPVHGVITDNQALNGSQPTSKNDYGILEFPAIAHHLGVYPSATGHFFNQLPRLFFLLKVLPEAVPIIINRFSLSEALVKLLVRLEIVKSNRFLPLQPNLYFAQKIFFAGEMGRHRESGDWYSLAVERCSFGLAQHRTIMREFLAEPLGMHDTSHAHLEVLVVDRRDATNSARAVSNHCPMMQALKDALGPYAAIREFVGSTMPLEDQIKAFMRADLLIAPHGAAIGLCGFMRPGGAVLEIAYPLRRWPAIFMPVALSSGLKYYLSFASKGKHSGPLTVKTSEVASLAIEAAKDIGRYQVKREGSDKQDRAISGLKAGNRKLSRKSPPALGSTCKLI